MVWKIYNMYQICNKIFSYFFLFLFICIVTLLDVFAFYHEDECVWLNESVKTEISVIEQEGDFVELLLEFSTHYPKFYINSFDIQAEKMKFTIENISGVRDFTAYYPNFDIIDIIEYGGEVKKENVFFLPFSIVVKMRLIDAEKPFSFSLSYLSCGKICFPSSENFVIKVADLPIVKDGYEHFVTDNIIKYM